MYANIQSAERAAWYRSCPTHGEWCPCVAVLRAWSSLEIVVRFLCGRSEYWRPDVWSHNL